jgi:hypothetical protein
MRKTNRSGMTALPKIDDDAINIAKGNAKMKNER